MATPNTRQPCAIGSHLNSGSTSSFNWQCPDCQSTDLVKLSLVYAAGTSAINGRSRGRGLRSLKTGSAWLQQNQSVGKNPDTALANGEPAAQETLPLRNCGLVAGVLFGPLHRCSLGAHYTRPRSAPAPAVRLLFMDVLCLSGLRAGGSVAVQPCRLPTTIPRVGSVFHVPALREASAIGPSSVTEAK